MDRVLYVALAVVVVASASTLVYAIARPKAKEAFTDFYMLGPEGKMENYPSQIGVNEKATLTLGVTNHENQVASYSVNVTFDGKVVQTIGPIELANDAEWSAPVTLTPSRIGDNQKIEFLLYKDHGNDAYLTLRLWLDVLK